MANETMNCNTVYHTMSVRAGMSRLDVQGAKAKLAQQKILSVMWVVRVCTIHKIGSGWQDMVSLIWLVIEYHKVPKKRACLNKCAPDF